MREDSVELLKYGPSFQTCLLQFHYVRSASELKPSELDACLALVEHTSGQDYRNSSIGWNTKRKRAEMLDEEMMYMLVRQSDSAEPTSHEEGEGKVGEDTDTRGKGNASLQPFDRFAAAHNLGGGILGFLSLMYTFDDPPHDDREVLYVYEVHLHESLRGRGLGSKLMEFAEGVAACCGISKIMLTVFTANKGARAMYEKLGYHRDSCSPHDRQMRNKVVKADYMILSKLLA